MGPVVAHAPLAHAVHAAPVVAHAVHAPVHHAVHAAPVVAHAVHAAPVVAHAVHAAPAYHAPVVAAPAYHAPVETYADEVSPYTTPMLLLMTIQRLPSMQRRPLMVPAMSRDLTELLFLMAESKL